jgi:hypothetical protein
MIVARDEWRTPSSTQKLDLEKSYLGRCSLEAKAQILERDHFRRPSNPTALWNEGGASMKPIKFLINHLISLVTLIFAIVATLWTHDLSQAAFWLWVSVLFLSADFAPRRWWR